MERGKWKALLVLLLALSGCGTQHTTPPLEGHYTYEHAFNYDMYGSHLDVHETGTMDFYADGTALDSARQVYVATMQDGDTFSWVYNYVSPTRWHLEGDTLYFAGIKESFRMEVVESGEPTGILAPQGRRPQLAQKIIDAYSNSIDYEYKFHVDTLTSDLLQWSFTYRDGHTDTWTFYRNEAE